MSKIGGKFKNGAALHNIHENGPQHCSSGNIQSLSSASQSEWSLARRQEPARILWVTLNGIPQNGQHGPEGTRTHVPPRRLDLDARRALAATSRCKRSHASTTSLRRICPSQKGDVNMNPAHNKHQACSNRSVDPIQEYSEVFPLFLTPRI